MAVNWCMLDKSSRPVPLPHEKLFLTVPSIAFSLQPTIDSSTLDKTVPAITATGTCFITSQRLVFVSAVATAQAASSGSADEFRTLSVPLHLFQDGRLVQPLFAANYYEALIRPVPSGGLTRAHMARITFKEGSSWPFVQAMDECKARYEEERGAQRQAAAGEDLPVYSPSLGSDFPAHGASTTRPTPGSAGFFDNAIQAHTQPNEDDLSAARVARECEDREEAQLRQGTDEGLPPAYDESTRP